MQKTLRILLLAALAIMPWAANAQNTLTVADGTSNNEYVPFYGFYADESQHNQVIYPADSLTDMNGMGITQMVFYIDQSAGNGGNTSADRLGTWTVSLGETTATTLSGIDNTTPLTQVYEGYFDCSTGTLTISFSSAYVYNGGNLLLDLNHEAASWNHWFFLGVSMTGASYCYDNQRNFLPKTTFSYGNPPSCIPASGLAASDITSNSVDLSWIDDQNSGATYTVYYWSGSDTLTETTSTTSVTLTNLNASTGYSCYVVANCASGDEAMPSNTVSFTTDCAGGSCEITVQMTDSYGDGWNGGHLNFYQNGALAGTAGLTSGSNGTATVSVCSGVTVTYNWTNGSYDNEVSYTILDGGNTPVYSSSTSGVSHSDSITNPCPTCLSPTALTVDSIDQNSAIISWTPRSEATLFAVYLNNELVSGSESGTTYTFSGLSANNLYTFGVQAICTSEDSSSIATISARTNCGATDLPFTVDFEDAAFNGAWYPCWDSTIHAGTDPSVNNVRNHTPGGTYGMYLQAKGSEQYNLVVGPEMNATGDNIYVRFWAYLNGGSRWIKAGVITNPHDTTTFVPLVTVENVSGWNEFEFTTADLDATANYRVAWLACYTDSPSSSGTQIGEIDDIYISEIPSCQRPTGATVSNFGARQFDITWNPVNGVTDYVVYYNTANNINGDNVQSENISGDTSATITGLQPETHYYVWVAANCGDSESEAYPAGNFTTLISCPTVTNMQVLDSLTTSDGATISWNAGDIETEWLVAVDSGEFESVYDTFYVVSGLDPMTAHTLHVRAFCGDDDTSSISSINFHTGCDNGECNIYVSTSATYTYYSGTVKVYQNGVQLASVNGNEQAVKVCSDMPVVALYQAPSYTWYSPSAIIRDGGMTDIFNGSTESYNTGDTLAVINTPCPECMPVDNLTVDTTITANSATIYWNSGAGSAWIIRIDSTYIDVVDTFYTFTSLEARTPYTVYVATNCNGDTSAYMSTSFTTDCAGGSCDVTVQMTDSYGDGWNGNAVEAYQNGALAGSATLASGSNGTATISVCSGIATEFRFHTGSYASEIGFTILDGGDDALYTAAQGSMSSVGNGAVLATTENACPTCLKPTGLIVSAIDSNSLEFVWDVADTAAGYIVSFNGGAWESANSGAYSAAPLTPNTSYTFSVRTLCGATDTSNTATVTVKTACGQMILPYTTSFEDDAQGTVPSCWTVVRPGYGNYPGVSGSEYTGSNGMTLAADYNDSTTIATSLVPLNGDEIYVSFWASVNQGNTLYAGVMTDLAYDTTFIPLLTIPYNNSTYTRYEFNTSTLYSQEQYYVAFRLVTSGSNHYADIDDIEIRLDEGCMYPANLTANPGAHNVQLTWSNSTSSATYVVQHRLTSATAWIDDATTFDTTYNVTGLNAAVSYSFRVGFICNADTLWSNITVPTTCDLMSLPYFEDFDSYANDVMPPCWEWNTSFCTHWDGGVFFRTYHGGGNEYVVMPQLDGNITKLQIEFDCKVGTIAEQDGILLGVADAAGVLVAWLDTIQDPNHSRNAHVHHIINMLSYNVPGNAARIAFAQYRNWGEWALIDNISVIELPSCYPVDSLTAYNLIDPDHTSFTWASLGEETAWQVYVDTVTVNIDSVPDSMFVDVYTRSYEIPMGTIQGGGIYTFYVRANCSIDQSNWNSYTFGAGTVIMNNSSVADTIVACGLVVYDNGGPIAGYLPNSNSALVIRSENVGSELEVFGAAFGIGSSGATLNIYDGEGTSGTLLYTYNTTDGRDTLLNTSLATSTTGALTVTFVANGSMCHTGYELYIHCVGSALCERPTQLNAVMTGVGEADVTWNGTSAAYELQYKLTGDSVWSSLTGITTTSTTLTGLMADTTYDLQVIGVCGTETSTPSFPIVLNTHFEVVITPCDPVTDLTVGNITTNSAELSWTSTASSWEIELTNVSGTTTQTATTNPYTLTGLVANMQYSVRMRSLCNGQYEEPSSEWSSAVTFTTAGGTTPTFTITVQSNNEAWGTVTGGGTYNEGTVVTLTATAADGYRFVQWNDADNTNPRSITVTANATYIATFEAIPTYTITATANDATMGTVTGGGTYQEGTEVTLTATANDGYIFVQWNDAVTTPVRTITVTADANYVATFADTSAELVYHMVTVNVNDSAMGSVSGAGEYLEGVSATLTATANAGYRFVEWNDHITDNPRNVVVNDDLTFTAIFEAIPSYTITVQANNNAWGTVTGGGTYLEGTTITLVATSNSGYHFVRWNDNVTDSTRQVVVSASETYTAYFDANVGIDDVELGNVSLFPNPATTSVTLGLDGIEGQVNIDIVDLNGRTVSQTVAHGNQAIRIDVSNLAQGAYFVRVTSERQTAVRKLIVK